MSIVTKNGDTGDTGLMYNRRVPKTHPRVEAYGTVDELNAALGLARSLAGHAELQSILLPIQEDLVGMMGELATAVEDLPRYTRDGYPRLRDATTARLEQVIADIEARGITYRGWATPGNNAGAAALDVARTVCRRAERCVCRLQESGQLQNDEIIVFLNRLSDLLWLLARVAEQS